MGMWRYGFGAPFIDVDEWRDEPRPHRYVHGGFTDTHTRFCFYFPPVASYRGRFFHFLEGGAGGHESVIGQEGARTSPWIFELALDEFGGYLVESNQGHFPNEGIGFTDDVELFGASAESAVYAKQLAAEMYGYEPARGYLWGASGGGSRAVYCMENRSEVWDGAVPLLMATTGVNQQWSAAACWWLHARHALHRIVDATEPGGSGNPFASLDSVGAAALAAAYKHGFPRGAECLFWSFAPWLWRAATVDPEYLRDFWSVRGYAGHDEPTRFAGVLLDRTTTIAAIARLGEIGAGAPSPPPAAADAPDGTYGVRLSDQEDDADGFFGAKLTVLAGVAEGREIYITGTDRGFLTTSGELDGRLFDGLEPGDAVHIDNRDFIAWCSYHRHTLGLAEIIEDDAGTTRLAPEFRGLGAYAVDGFALVEQRSTHAVVGGGPGHTGNLAGKMIHVNGTHDSMIWPSGAASYARKARRHLGEDIDRHYRLWFLEHAAHGEPEMIGPMATPEPRRGVWRSRLVGYEGATMQALRDLVAWVEDGVEPPPTTGHRFNDDGRLVLAATAGERQGIQPVVTATANGGARTEVAVGEPVELRAAAASAAGRGTIVAAEWDFHGTGDADHVFDVSGHDESVDLHVTHVYEEPGVYFASFRVGAHRDGVIGTGPPVFNLARVRVVVT